ncbi:MAG TPA: KUP/HAK/KT family potassium transporter, partial [Stellaceae bacterium]|nr:KUP/HAK/KT family potassium transporter [Stellaceae bacterium]
MTVAAVQRETETRDKARYALLLGALGVVYGDIGTSPLYTEQLCFGETRDITYHGVLGVLSLILWSLIIVVTVKYVLVVMRADNRGEGGSLALLALVTDLTRESRATYFVTMLGIFAAALFYGDSMITPAISVLSAVEGLDVVAPAFKSYVLPVTIAVLCGLFLIQRSGTDFIGRLF